MIIPVRCFTCGKVIGEIYENFLQRVEMGEKPEEVLDELGLDRFCCRKMIVAHADLINEVIPYG